MPIFSLSRPFENLLSQAEMQAMALVNHFGSDLPEWREGRDLEHRKISKESELEEWRAELAATSDEILHFSSQVVGADQTIRISILGFAGSAVMLLAGLVVGIMPLAIGAIALMTGLLFFGISKKKIKSAAVDKLDHCAVRQSNLNMEISGGLSSLKKMQDEIASRADAYPEVSLAQVQLGMEIVKVGDRTVMLDNAGFHETVTFKVVDPSSIKKKIKKIRPAIDKLRHIPAMLTGEEGGKSLDPLNTLYGEEENISELIDVFSTGLGELANIEIGLPLVEGGSTLAQRFANGELDPVLPGDVLALKGDAASEKIDAFVDIINDAKKNGIDVLAGIQEVSEGLGEICDLYGFARQDSINTLHTNLLEVLNKASWCSKKFYCPRTIMSPSYIQALIGIDLADAHLLPINILLERLRSEPEIARRMDISPDLPQQLFAQSAAIYQFTEHARSFEMDGSALSVERGRVFQDEEAELIKTFRLTLQRAMTGATRPLLSFSKESVLYFDPETESWTSPTSPHTYSTLDVIQYGSVVKVCSDLLIPLWENLWTEKADFRKSELFRTNEAMISMSEKEAEKLIDIANQFRSDMRTIRENANIFRSELTSKIAEIHEFKSSMNEIGLLSERSSAGLSDERIAGLDLEGGDVASIDGYENALTRLPQAQAQSRGTVHDPIDYVREPGIIVRSIPISKRLVLTIGQDNV